MCHGIRWSATSFDQEARTTPSTSIISEKTEPLFSEILHARIHRRRMVTDPVSLCRIVSGQQLAGSATLIIWRRLLNVVGATEEDTSILSPDRILSIKDSNVEAKLRAPAGLSNTKCKCIISIAKCFRDGTISDALLGGHVSDDEVRSRLMAIKGVGPWTICFDSSTLGIRSFNDQLILSDSPIISSVQMFLIYNNHRSDVLPIGDFAMRKGTC